MSVDDKPRTPHTIVRASAGSGKTYRLTNQLLSQLITGEDPKTLLATTFTRSASGEILYRVLDRLSSAILSNKALEELSDAIEYHGLTNEKCTEALERLVQNSHRLSVITMDSFFSRLASSFGLELGLPNAYRMLDEDEAQDLKERCVDQAIDECTNNELLGILQALQGDRVQMMAHSAILQVVRSAHAMYLATGSEILPWQSIKPKGAKLSEIQLHDAIVNLQAASIPVSGSGKPHGSWINSRDSLVNCLQRESWDTVLTQGLVSKMLDRAGFNTPQTYYKLEFTSDLIEALVPIIDHARYMVTSKLARRTLSIYQLMNRFDSLYSDAKMANGTIDFNDPPRLLNESGLTGDLEHMYYRLDSTIRHVLLDEFQDTSMPQFQLIEPILDELLSQDRDGRSVFVVGDIKQSLYGWRQAEPKLLTAMTDRWTTFQEDRLNTSWRSSQAVLDTVNAIFGDLKHNEAMQSSIIGQDIASDWDDEFVTHVAQNKKHPGSSRLIIANSDSEHSRDALEEVLWECATQILEARSTSPHSSIAVLLRQGKHIVRLITMLNNLGIDACEERGSPLVNSPCVAAAVSMLRLIEHPSDKAAWQHVRSTPLGEQLNLGDFDQIGLIASKLRKTISDQGSVSVLNHWYRATVDSMDSRGSERFMQFIELAGEMNDRGRRGIAQLVLAAQSKKIEERGQAPVRVITIHKSKGLEFDTVILPLLGPRWQLKPNSIISKRNNPLGPITAVSAYPSKPARAACSELAELFEHCSLKETNEELCCLYVAMTRAKSKLLMIAPADDFGRRQEPTKKLVLSPAHVIIAALAPDKPCIPGDTLYAHSTETRGSIVIDQPMQSPAMDLDPAKTISVDIRKAINPGHSSSMSESPSKIRTTPTQSANSYLDHHTTSQDATTLGSCIHAAFENISWVDQEPVDPVALHQRLRGLGYSDRHTEIAIEQLHAALKCPETRMFFDKDQWLNHHKLGIDPSVHTERPFAVRLGTENNSRLLQGRFDRIILGFQNNQLEQIQIIDFKSDEAANGLSPESLLSYAERYRPQMEAYCTAAQRLYSIDPGCIDLILLFTHRSGHVKLHPSGDKNASPPRPV